jgi:hypothetical protein
LSRVSFHRGEKRSPNFTADTIEVSIEKETLWGDRING